MKQVFQDVRSGETAVIEVPVPNPQPGAVLVRTAVSLVSAGTERMMVEFAGKSLLGKARSRPDLVQQVVDRVRREGLLAVADAVRNRLDQPMPVGYSSAGTIAAVGSGVTGYRVGDRVACAGGGYAVHAEYAVVPQNLLAHIPDSVDFESGAFTTLGAIALHGFRLAEPQMGERVAVIGLGLLGLLSVEIALAAGCTVLGVDLDPVRVELAHGLGAEAILRGDAEDAAAAHSRGEGFDLILICADTPSDDPVELAGEIARDRARVVAIGAVGMGIPRRVYYEKELSIIVSRSYGPGRYDPTYEEKGQDYPIGYVRWTEGRNLSAFVDLLAKGQLDVQPLISHRFPIERATEVYSLITGKASASFLGVLLTYPSLQDEAGAVERKITIAEKLVSPTSPLRLGVLGAGNFATGVLFPALRRVRGIEFIGLADAAGLKGVRAGQRYGFRYATTDEEEILADEQINTVAVLTRHNLHAWQVVAALKAGKHVFCEKPLALNRDELTDVAATANASDKLLSVGYNRRFAPLAVRMKNFFDAVHEPLVLHYRVNAGYLPPEHWVHDPDQGGGRIVGEVCHFIDFMTFLVDAMPQRVLAYGLPDNSRYKEDNVVIMIEFPDGSLGTIAYLAAGDRGLPKERVEVFGGGRVAVLDDFRRLEMYSGGRRRIRRAWFRRDKGHRDEWIAFVAAVASGGAPPIPYEQLFAVTTTSFAVVESLRSGEPITIEPLTVG